MLDVDERGEPWDILAVGVIVGGGDAAQLGLLISSILGEPGLDGTGVLLYDGNIGEGGRRGRLAVNLDC